MLLRLLLPVTVISKPSSLMLNLYFMYWLHPLFQTMDLITICHPPALLISLSLSPCVWDCINMDVYTCCHFQTGWTLLSFSLVLSFCNTFPLISAFLLIKPSISAQWLWRQIYFKKQLFFISRCWNDVFSQLNFISWYLSNVAISAHWLKNTLCLILGWKKKKICLMDSFEHLMRRN